MKFIKQLFCPHPRRQCNEYSEFGFEADTRIIFSAFELFGTKETRYECKKCGKLFWYTKCDMAYETALESLKEEFSK